MIAAINYIKERSFSGLLHRRLKRDRLMGEEKMLQVIDIDIYMNVSVSVSCGQRGPLNKIANMLWMCASMGRM